MHFKLDEFTETLVLGGVTLAILIYALRTGSAWLGSPIDPMAAFRWIEGLFRPLNGNRLRSDSQPPLSPNGENGGEGDIGANVSLPTRLIYISRIAIGLTVVYTLGLFVFDVSHDFAAERNLLSVAVDDYLDSDFSLRLRSLFSVRASTETGALLTRTPLYYDLMNERGHLTPYLRQKLVELDRKLDDATIAKPNEAVVYVRRGEHPPAIPMERLHVEVNRLFYAAKNAVYRDAQYFAELRDLETRAAFFRALVVLSLVGAVVAFVCYLPSPCTKALFVVPTVVAVCLVVIWYTNWERRITTDINDGILVESAHNASFSDSLETMDALELGAIPKLRIWTVYLWRATRRLGSVWLLAVLAALLCDLWLRTQSARRIGIQSAPLIAAGFLVCHLCARYTYAQEATNYNRRAFGYYQSLLAAQTENAKREATLGSTCIRLGGTVYAQVSGEFAGLCLQSYRIATDSLQKKLAARVGQQGAKPPAVVLDLDETVLNNSTFQSWLVRSGCQYSEELWQRYVMTCGNEAQLIPGAMPFLQDAAKSSVRVCFVSNRRELLRARTIEVLRRLGVWSGNARSAAPLLLLAKDDEKRPNKIERMRDLALHYDVMLFIGDSLGDFPEKFAVEQDDLGVKHVAESIRKKVVALRYKWGQDWILIPNAAYGGWADLVNDSPLESIGHSAMEATMQCR